MRIPCLGLILGAFVLACGCTGDGSVDDDAIGDDDTTGDDDATGDDDSTPVGVPDSLTLAPSIPYPAWGDRYDDYAQVYVHDASIFDPARMQLWTVAPAVYADLPEGGDQPVYILPYGHHYAGGGGAYTDTDVLRAMADEIAARGLPFTFYTDGIATELAQTDDPDFFDHLNALGFHLGYHGEQDHGPEPRIVADATSPLCPSLVEGMDWDEAVEAIEHRYSHGIEVALTDTGQGLSMLDPSLQHGITDPSREGGLVLVQSAYGRDVDVVTTHSCEVAAAEEAFGALGSYSVLQSTGILSGKYWAVNLDLPDLAEEAAGIGGDTSFFWYMGKLQEKTFSGHGYTYMDLADPGATLDGLDRTQPQYVVMSVGGLQSDPTDFSAFYEALDYLVTHLSDHEPAYVVGTGDLPALFEPLETEPMFTADELGVLVDALLAAWDGRPPEYVDLGEDGAWPLVIVLSALAQSLAEYAVHGSLLDPVHPYMLLGPIGELPSASASAVEVPFEDVLQVARDLRDTATATDRWPTTVELEGGQSVNIAEAMELMAQAYQALSE